MKKGRRGRREMNDEKRDENLRGKLRELQKELEIKNRHIRSLEKRLETASRPITEDDENNDNRREEQDPRCPQCGSTGRKVASFWHPVKEDLVVKIECDNCGHNFKDDKK